MDTRPRNPAKHGRVSLCPSIHPPASDRFTDPPAVRSPQSCFGEVTAEFQDVPQGWENAYWNAEWKIFLQILSTTYIVPCRFQPGFSLRDGSPGVLSLHSLTWSLEVGEWAHSEADLEIGLFSY